MVQITFTSAQLELVAYCLHEVKKLEQGKMETSLKGPKNLASTVASNLVYRIEELQRFLEIKMGRE